MNQVTVSVEIERALDEVWNVFNDPRHIIHWNFAHESWECPAASNDLRKGGQLNVRMQAKDGSFGFDLIGIYDEIIDRQVLRYHLEDGRNVEVVFEELSANKTKLTENFDPENVNPESFQKEGWQAILDNFKKYAESI